MKLPKYLLLNKQVGETPLEVLENFKKENHTYAAVPMSYAGRLDPLASGKLLVLVGEECKKQKKYQGLDKEYEFEVLLGFSTDTRDVLGIADTHNTFPAEMPNTHAITKVIKNLAGKRSMAYPAFSSKTVNGTPLFKYALEGRLHEIEIPKKDIEIYSLTHKSTKEIPKFKLFSLMSQKIESIKPVTEHTKALGNDFRRSEIRTRYKELESSISEDQKIYILKCTCICSSGTYMRTLAREIANMMGYEGLAFSIHRTKIGKYVKYGPFGFWKKLY